MDARNAQTCCAVSLVPGLFHIHYYYFCCCYFTTSIATTTTVHYYTWRKMQLVKGAISIECGDVKWQGVKLPLPDRGVTSYSNPAE